MEPMLTILPPPWRTHLAYLPADEDGAVEVHVHHLAHHICGIVLRLGVGADAGGVDEDVDAAVLFGDLGDHFRHLLIVGHIQLVDVAGQAVLRHFCLHLLGLADGGIGKNDLCAVHSHAPADILAQAAGTHYQDHLVLQGKKVFDLAVFHNVHAVPPRIIGCLTAPARPGYRPSCHGQEHGLDLMEPAAVRPG